MNMITPYLLAALPGAFPSRTAVGGDIIQMVADAGLVVKFVLLVLCAFSVASWAIIFMKWRLFRNAAQETDYFLDLFWESTALNQLYKETEDFLWSPVAHLFRSGYSELRRSIKVQNPNTAKEWDPAVQPLIENVRRSMRRTSIDQGGKMEAALSFLATTGNTAPFIGLFGTVWGIMESFRGIGMTASANLAVVAPGISEALIATAAGLAAAIPAVIAFNLFTNKAMVLKSEMDTFSSDFLSLVERQFVKKKIVSKEQG